MLRKFLLALALALVGLFAVAGVASAAPYPGPPNPPGVTVNQTIIVNGGVVIFAGGGFTPGETINITIIYNAAPSGLRANAALRLAAKAAESQTTTADASGNFTSGVRLTQAGTATITATGLTSGKTFSTTVTVVAEGGNTSPGTTTVAGQTTAAGEVTTANAAPVTAGADGTGGAGLASTGASVAGPLTIGAAALIAGLSLLFFGTRLAIRRKQAPSAR